MKKWMFLTMNFMQSLHWTTKIFQKEALNIHKKTGQVPCLVASVNNQFLMILCSIDDITGYTEKMNKFGNITS